MLSALRRGPKRRCWRTFGRSRKGPSTRQPHGRPSWNESHGCFWHQLVVGRFRLQAASAGPVMQWTPLVTKGPNPVTSRLEQPTGMCRDRDRSRSPSSVLVFEERFAVSNPQALSLGISHAGLVREDLRDVLHGFGDFEVKGGEQSRRPLRSSAKQRRRLRCFRQYLAVLFFAMMLIYG